MRIIGTKAYGIRLPIINPGDNLSGFVADALMSACAAEGFEISETDVVGITEAVVAKAQNNFASTDEIGADVCQKFGGGVVGAVFPILSRNRFLNILKGIAKGADEVALLLSFPADEQGNPLISPDKIDAFYDKTGGKSGPFTAKEFLALAGEYPHPFTGIEYISLYENAAENIKVYISDDPRDILKLTKNVLVCEVHGRFRIKARLLKAGAEKVYALSDVLSKPVSPGCSFNPEYGVLGSNMSAGGRLKLFPRNCREFADEVRQKIYLQSGKAPEVMVYGDGAFKDPTCGIWELADPVVSPGFTDRLGGTPSELKLKFIADEMFGHLSGDEKTKAIAEFIKNKNDDETAALREGTTPRKYADLLGSLCDLMSGSGDKGTPVILVKGYFDDYSAE